MKIAICAQQNNTQAPVDSRFGRSPWYAIYDDQTQEWSFIENSQNLQAAQGAGTQAAQHIIDADAEVLLACNVGPKAVAALRAGSIQMYLTVPGMTIEQALLEYLNGRLKSAEQANVEGHWM